MSNFPARKVSKAFRRSPPRRSQILAAQKRIQQAALAGVIIHNQNARRLGGFFAQFGCHAPKLSESRHEFQVGDAENGTFRLVGQANDFPAVRQNDLLHDRKTEAGAFFVAW